MGVREEVTKVTSGLHAVVSEPQEDEEWEGGEELSFAPLDAQLPGKAGLTNAGCPFHYHHPEVDD